MRSQCALRISAIEWENAGIIHHLKRPVRVTASRSGSVADTETMPQPAEILPDLYSSVSSAPS